MQDDVMSCINGPWCGNMNEDERSALFWSKKIGKMLKKMHREELKRIRLLLLGIGESGKSTITKQMKIIHINGYSVAERHEKFQDIKQNVRESILAVLLGMRQLSIPLQCPENRQSEAFILADARNPTEDVKPAFWDHCQRLWNDGGVQECYQRSHEYQLIDSAKYFLDKISDLRQPGYTPSDQDILRCRATTTSITNIEFDVPDAGEQVKFSVYDVGGQRGERKKWIQVFDNVVAILYLADVSAFDLTLREQKGKNKLLESLEIFEQVWNNRFLAPVSVLLFLNKIDTLAEKVSRGRSIQALVEQFPDVFPDFETFKPSKDEMTEFLESFPAPATGDAPRAKKRGSRTDIAPEVTKTAVYIKMLFMKIVSREIQVSPKNLVRGKEHHMNHSCEYFYTCAVNTDNVKKVLDGCRTLIIRKHLERFGII